MHIITNGIAINTDAICKIEKKDDLTLKITMTNGESMDFKFKSGETCEQKMQELIKEQPASASMVSLAAAAIRIKYHNKNLEKLCYVEGKSDWIDLRCAKKTELKKGDFALIDLGVSMEIPDGYEAHLAPRSSTFKNYGILQTNSIGVIDNSYSGDNDIWKMPVYATRDTVIEEGDRICQFRIMANQPVISFEEVEHLKEEDRGGFGSTGVN